MTRTLGRVAARIVDLASIIGVLCLVALVVALVSGVRPVVLRTGSMAPTMPAGTLVMSVPVPGQDITTGDVVTVETRSGVLVTHRVLTVDHDGAAWTATLQGDANETPDGETYDVTDGARKVVAVVPGLGPVLMAAHGPWLVAGAVALVAIALLPGRRDPAESAEPDPAGGPEADPADGREADPADGRYADRTHGRHAGPADDGPSTEDQAARHGRHAAEQSSTPEERTAHV